MTTVLDRCVREKSGYWLESLDDIDFGATLVLVSTKAVLAPVLRSSVSLIRNDLLEGLVILRLDWRKIDQNLNEFTVDFGLTRSVTSIAIALFKTTSVKNAAILCGISYETAREYLEAARAAIGADTLPQLITLMGIAAGLSDGDAEETDALMVRALGLTNRQSRIAGLIADGLARSEVAERTGLSQALLKKELGIVFAATGVSGAIGLARVMLELRLLALGTNIAALPDPSGEPQYATIHCECAGGRIIAASDYGPWDGKPTLMLHSSMTSRAVNRTLVKALQGRGFRPVAVDRPGFGDSSNAPSDCWGDDYFQYAANDLQQFCIQQGWERVAIVARGAAQIVLAIHGLAPDLIGGAVVINPDPDAQSSSYRGTFLAKMKRHFVRRPRAVWFMARWLARSSTFERVRDHLQRAAVSCDADQRAMQTEVNLQDYYRGIRAFRAGALDGFVREQVALATCGKPKPVCRTSHFTLLVGEHDTLHDPMETASYWRDVLPDADVRIVPNSGRFLSYSHPEVAVSALVDMLTLETKL